jgi:holo-[acyl-carrier protein] synthase
MSIIGLGVDMIEVARIQHSLDRFGQRFVQRVFTAGEVAYCTSMKFPARHFAARFAAKEAVSKAFGTGEPFVVLCGRAESLATQREVGSVLISLSHTHEHAIAVIALQT